jgi:hypothetical protein
VSPPRRNQSIAGGSYIRIAPRGRRRHPLIQLFAMPKGHYATGSRPVLSGSSSQPATTVAVVTACRRVPTDNRAANTPASARDNNVAPRRRKPPCDGSSTRPLPPSACPLQQLATPPSDPRRDAPTRLAPSTLNLDALATSGGDESLAVATDADDGELVGPWLRSNLMRQTTWQGARVGDAMDIERYLTHALPGPASWPELTPGSRSQEGPRAIPAPQRSAPTGTTASPTTAATGRRQGSRLTQPRSRGSPTPRAPP